MSFREFPPHELYETCKGTKARTSDKPCCFYGRVANSGTMNGLCAATNDPPSPYCVWETTEFWVGVCGTDAQGNPIKPEGMVACLGDLIAEAAPHAFDVSFDNAYEFFLKCIPEPSLMFDYLRGTRTDFEIADLSGNASALAALHDTFHFQDPTLPYLYGVKIITAPGAKYAANLILDVDTSNDPENKLGQQLQDSRLEGFYTESFWTDGERRKFKVCESPYFMITSSIIKGTLELKITDTTMAGVIDTEIAMDEGKLAEGITVNKGIFYVVNSTNGLPINLNTKGPVYLQGVKNSGRVAGQMPINVFMVDVHNDAQGFVEFPAGSVVYIHSTRNDGEVQANENLSEGGMDVVINNTINSATGKVNAKGGTFTIADTSNAGRLSTTATALSLLNVTNTGQITAQDLLDTVVNGATNTGKLYAKVAPGSKITLNNVTAEKGSDVDFAVDAEDITITNSVLRSARINTPKPTGRQAASLASSHKVAISDTTIGSYVSIDLGGTSDGVSFNGVKVEKYATLKFSGCGALTGTLTGTGKVEIPCGTVDLTAEGVELSLGDAVEGKVTHCGNVAASSSVELTKECATPAPPGNTPAPPMPAHLQTVCEGLANISISHKGEACRAGDTCAAEGEECVTISAEYLAQLNEAGAAYEGFGCCGPSFDGVGMATPALWLLFAAVVAALL